MNDAAVERAMASVETLVPQKVVESSRGRAWPGFEVMAARLDDGALDVDGLSAHTLAINVGAAFRLEGRVSGRRRDGVLPTGSMKIIEAGPRSAWRWNPRRPIDMLHVSIDDDALQSYGRELELHGVPEIVTRVGFLDEELRGIGEALGAALRTASVQSLVAESLRIALLARILAQHSSVAQSVVMRLPKGRLQARDVKALDDYIEAHLGTTFGIGDLAALSGLSRFHFARLFRATVGTSPHRYVLNRRVERARELLRAANLPLRDIAVAAGFADQSHLSRQVKRRYGMTPGALRSS